ADDHGQTWPGEALRSVSVGDVIKITGPGHWIIHLRVDPVGFTPVPEPTHLTALAGTPPPRHCRTPQHPPRPPPRNPTAPPRAHPPARHPRNPPRPPLLNPTTPPTPPAPDPHVPARGPLRIRPHRDLPG